ncbi:DsbA family protein [Teichococcus aestuarii]|uniref:Disulfide bond formation protein DsbA n=1 Tax=Teichococcus aestuarii TaxID=568898 RepID=A0A2U1UYV5_9PROT|nr:thioredoxin domain-containing protein [Pseudoroseomonas aestuarii]PWC26836.1 disulfide bond formation protein DsbA [Pseudoroseomonas aestuarii]
MNRRALTIGTGALALAGFSVAAWLYPRAEVAGPATTGQDDIYVRPHSPIIGKAEARVTLVEFFDPSCEACRAFHPILGQILARHPEDVRLVLRYAPFHEGSDEAVRILEAARLQNRFEPVLDALFARQPEWAVHGAPNLEHAWGIAGIAGLDLARARQDARRPQIERVLQADTADLQALQVRQTPTFFVNTRPLLSFGPRQLYELILSELSTSR